MYKRGNVRAAVKEFRKALELDDTNFRAHTGIGEAYFDLNKTSDAIKHLKQAISLNPRGPQAFVILGGVYQATGDNKKAKQSYQRYLKIAPNGKFASDIRMILDAL